MPSSQTEINSNWQAGFTVDSFFYDNGRRKNDQ